MRDLKLLRRAGAAAVAAAAIAVAAVASTHADGGGPVVRMPDGAVQGTTQDGQRLFQGIPYAAPPERWKSPRRVTAWNGLRNASSPGNECVQAAVFWRPGSPASWNEDCLNLNVRTPKRVDRRLPVLVWFHGGGRVNGAGTDVQPARLTEWGDNVVVTVNYRLGAMGFLSLPGLDAESADGQSSGNYGDLDKIEALRWVQRNIAEFGGDPDRVTIAGQSAGAGGVCWLAGSPAARGPFHRAVVQSSGSCAAVSHDTAVARGTAFAEAAGCTDPGTTVTCLRAKSPAEIIDAQAAAGVSWSGVVGGASQPLPTEEAFASGRFNRVPVIFGNTRNENRAFVYEQYDLVRQPLTAQTYEARVRADFGDGADRVLAEYPASGYDVPGLALATLQSDQRACTSVAVTDALSAWVPTYTYEFRDETAPGRPYMVIPPSFPIGTGHTSDVPYVWQTETNVPLNREQLRLSKLMIAYWSRFARDGDPNARGLPAWPRSESSRRLRIGLLAGGATEVIAGAGYGTEHRCAFWQSQS